MEIVLKAGIESQIGLTILMVATLAAVFIFLIRSKSTERHEPNVVRADPPIRNPGDPAFLRRRAHAAAAATLLHRKRHSQGELNEKS